MQNCPDPDLRPPSPASAAPRFSCLTYRTRNLGDMIQTMALTRLLPPMSAVFRHALASAPRDQVFVVNGFLENDPTPRDGARCLFAGVSGPYQHHARFLTWLGRSPWPVGARDPATAQRLTRAGLATEMIGCATLTLPRYHGPRSGIYSVDHAGPGERLTHTIPRTLSLPDQWQRAAAMLARYRTAEAVHTSRLHVALPCLAFGTPVWIAPPDPRDLPDRFSLLAALGVPTGQWVVHDPAPFAGRYREFLRRQLGVAVAEGEPQPPRLVTPDQLAWRDAFRFRREDFVWTVRRRCQDWWSRRGRRSPRA